MPKSITLAALLFFSVILSAQSTPAFTPQEDDYILHDFQFKSGEKLPEVRMHYATLGKPAHDATGKVTRVKIISASPYPEFNQAADKAAHEEEFEPALRDGIPIPYTLSYTYRFRLETP